MQKLKRNFAALNKAAIKAGLVTAREIYQFRATHDIGTSANKAEKKEGMLPEITHGMPHRYEFRRYIPILNYKCLIVYLLFRLLLIP